MARRSRTQREASGTSEPNHVAYECLIVEAQRVGWPTAFHSDLVEFDYNRLHGVNGSPIPRQFGWNLRPSGTTFAAVGDLEDFERLAVHPISYGSDGHGKYYRYDGTALRACTLDELLTWLGRQIDPTPHAQTVAEAAEVRWQATPPRGSTDKEQQRAYAEATERWEAAKVAHQRAVEIAEQYRR